MDRSRLRRGANGYQFLDIVQADLGEQYTKGGEEPQTVAVQLTTAMDEPFVNRTVRALLSEEAQRRIIKALSANLRGETLQ